MVYYNAMFLDSENLNLSLTIFAFRVSVLTEMNENSITGNRNVRLRHRLKFIVQVKKFCFAKKKHGSVRFFFRLNAIRGERIRLLY